jgi:choline kinase
VPELARRYGLDVDVRFNDRYDTANNAYSLWLGRDRFASGAIVVNGDTVHPPSVERALLAARAQAPLLLAVDDVKVLGDEEMKVTLDHDGDVQRISKQLDPALASGEYIGVSLIDGSVARPLTDALEHTFERDPSRWYEDGFQEYVDRGGHMRAVPIGDVAWGEVDDHDDLAYVRGFSCPS